MYLPCLPTKYLCCLRRPLGRGDGERRSKRGQELLPGGVACGVAVCEYECEYFMFSRVCVWVCSARHMKNGKEPTEYRGQSKTPQLPGYVLLP